jgi:hypothetical protein
MIELMLDMFPEGTTRLWARNEKGLLFSVSIAPEKTGGYAATASVSEGSRFGVHTLVERKASSPVAFTADDADAMMTEVANEVLGPVDLMRLLVAWEKTGPRGK